MTVADHDPGDEDRRDLVGDLPVKHLLRQIFGDPFTVAESKLYHRVCAEELAAARIKRGECPCGCVG